MFKQATYELLSNFKESIRMIIHDNEGEMDLDDLKSEINVFLIADGVEFNEAYDYNIFNFISDDELVNWLQKNDICYAYESIRISVREIDYVKGEEK